MIMTRKLTSMKMKKNNVPCEDLDNLLDMYEEEFIEQISYANEEGYQGFCDY